MITCKELACQVKQELKDYFNEYHSSIAIITNGTPDGERYTRNKMKVANELGVHAIKLEFSKAFNMDELIECIKAIPAVGIMIQMPFYDEEAKNQKLLEAIPNYADVDGLTKDALVIPATAKGVFEYLITNDLINGKKIVIIGRSKLVGLPLAKLLTGLNCTVTMCHSKTPDIKEYTKVADVVVCAVGKRNFLDNSFINDNTHVIDVGINFDEDGKLCGDCNAEIINRTPVPNGVGLLTTAYLYDNLKELTEKLPKI